MVRRDGIGCKAGRRMKRRGALAWAALSLCASAGAGSVRTIGFLCGASAKEWAPFVDAFREGLANAGFVEGRDVSIVYRYADGRYERLPSLARSLVTQGVAVLVATASGAAVHAARDATRTIPIIFTLGNDPVAMGLVPSLGRPGGNLTGAMLFAQSLMSKRLELLRELLPQARAFAVLVNPDSRALDVYIAESQRAAHSLGVGCRCCAPATSTRSPRRSHGPRRNAS